MKHLAKNPWVTHWVRTDEPLMWLKSSGHQIVSASDKYWFDCRKKEPVLVIQLTLRGAGFHERNGKTTLLTPGMAFCEIGPGDYRYGYPPDATAEYEQVWLDLDGPAARLIWDHIIAKFGNVLTFGPMNPVAPLMLALAHQHARTLHHDRYRLSQQIYEIVMTAVSVLNRSRLDTAPMVARAIELIEKHGANSAITIEEIADSVGCSREHLARIFTSAVGVGPGEYLLQHRLNRAAQELRQNRDKLDLVARRSGFSGANYFCRIFRKHMGLTPNEFRVRQWRK